MDFNENARFSVAAQLVASEVNDETVILDYAKGSYFSVEGVGSVLWGALQQGSKSLEELCALVLEEFDVDAETCKADVIAFLESLQKNGLLQLNQ